MTSILSIRFEKDYTRTKSKEVEDSEEIRRLKTEKSILRHRVDALEDVRELGILSHIYPFH